MGVGELYAVAYPGGADGAASPPPILKMSQKTFFYSYYTNMFVPNVSQHNKIM